MLRKIIFLGFYLSLINFSLYGQVVNLPCQTDETAMMGVTATIDLDRKNFGGPFSQGYLHNFDIPNNFGDCKRIDQIDVDIAIFSIDATGLDPTCNVFSYFTNLYNNCTDFATGSCGSFADDNSNPIDMNQSFTFSNPTGGFPSQTFDLGSVFGVDIVPAMSNTGCPDGQNTILSGGITIDYEICVTITIVDDVASSTVDLGQDITVCPSSDAQLDAGAGFSSYIWGPNGEMTQTINTGPGTYTVTVTDNNGCSSEDEIIVDAFPTPTIDFSPNDPMVCNNGTTTIGVTQSYSSYAWNIGLGSQNVDVGPGTFTVTVTDNNNCTNEASITVQNVAPPNPGNNNATITCNNGAVVNFDALLGVHDNGGTWSDVNFSGVDPNIDDQNASFLGVPPNSYDFVYTVAGIGPCPPEQAIITVTVFPEVDAGTDNAVSFCEGTGAVNFFDLLGNPDISGFWTNLNNANVDLTDGSSVDLSQLTLGSYTFTYMLPANGGCPSDQAFLTIAIQTGANAGDDNSISICEGADFDLATLVSANADGGGDFVDINSIGNLTGSTITTSGLAGQSLTYEYRVGDSNGMCGQDIATIIVNIESSLSAGISTDSTFCSGGNIDLFTLLSNEDAGGTFTDIDGAGGLAGSMLNTAGITPGTYNFSYRIGDGVTCPVDESSFEITITDGPSGSFDINDFSLCEGQCQEVNYLVNGVNSIDVESSITLFSVSSTIPVSQIVNNDSLSIVFCNDPGGGSASGDTIFISPTDTIQLNIETITDELCSVDVMDSILITTVSQNSFVLDTSICISDTLVISGMQFFVGNESFIDTLSGGACDSIVNINVTFTESDTVRFNDIICDGDSILLFGTFYTADNSMDEFMLGSGSGCDSLIQINIDFFPESSSIIDDALCENQSLMINGELYNQANPSGVETIENGSVNGCDSIITVMLTFSPSATLLIDDQFCSDDQIMVGNEIFDINNSTGTVTLPGTECDTVVTIDLSFFADATGDFTGTFCDDFSIDIGGITFDINNPQDEITISNGSINGCDSTVMVDLDFFPQAMGMFNGTFCRNFTIDIGVVTFDIDNPQDVVIIPNASINGCDSTVMVDLDFFQESISTVDDEVCENEVLFVLNGTEYGGMNTTGTEIIPNGSSNGCDSTVIIALLLNQTTRENINETICEGDSILINDIYQTTPGNYADTLQQVNGCDSIITTILALENCMLNIGINQTNNVCEDDDNGIIILNGLETVMPPFTVSSIGQNMGITDMVTFDDITDAYILTGLISDIYEITITNANGDVLDQFDVEIIFTNPSINIDAATVNPPICNGDLASIILDISGGSEPFIFQWTDPTIGNTNQATDLSPMQYGVTITDMTGCMTDTMFMIDDVEAIDATFESLNVSCENEMDGSIRILNVQNGVEPYLLLLNGDILLNNQINGLAAGVYTVSVIDAIGCSSEEMTIEIENSESLFANYQTSYIIQGDSIQIVGDLLNDSLFFEWNVNTGLSCTDCPFPLFSSTISEILELTVSDTTGCSQQFIFEVTVEDIDLDNLIPNVFSPNGDGTNDIFEINLDPTRIASMQMNIYDRWGSLVYSELSTDGSIGWNGDIDGQTGLNGVYVYTLDVVYLDNERETALGDLTLIR